MSEAWLFIQVKLLEAKANEMPPSDKGADTQTNSVSNFQFILYAIQVCTIKQP